jgi:crotonobetainyl-CoA:carnitine CoA-transferase CaiB-like acyl-CoA transferase
MAPLDGVKVLDFTHAYAGPMCTRQLELCGAHVVKVEPPGEGDDFRARPSFFAMNSAKRSITIDLKRPEGREVAYRLAEDADVVVENYRPGVAEKLGVDWPSMHARFPQLIYCSITGFGNSGPLRDRAAIEWVIQAVSGVTDLYTPKDADPRASGPAVVDAFAGYVAFSAVLASLLERQKTGVGHYVDVSMFESLLTLQTSQVLSAYAAKASGGSSRGEGSNSGLRSTMARYQAKDRPLFIAMLTQRWFETVARIIGRPELIDDPRYVDNAHRMAAGLDFVHDIEQGLSTRTAEEWETELAAANIPVGAVRTVSEALDLTQIKERSFLRATTDVDGSEKAVLGLPFLIDERDEGSPERVPGLGADTDDVLRESGYSPEEIAELHELNIV